MVRVLGVLFAVGTLTQAIVAGRFVTGDVDLLRVHGAVGGSLVLFPMVQMVAAVLLWWFGRGPVWYLAYPPVLFVLVVTQIGAGGARNLALHIPLGTALVGVAAWNLTWSFGFRRHREPTI
ncbi:MULTISPECIES: hypothetical protein [unclassified Embleya]|uniref:hypothetical protein n=1 Tax=Embleya sp. NPDC127516 TaxID=3363990 RepID=UPI00380EEC40